MPGKGTKKPLKNKKSKKGPPTAEELAFKKSQSANKKAERDAAAKLTGKKGGKKK
jgi:hypothetical protein|tara:strand:+ start:262 stop:426 length:165 start_codon:yes stop_codon:yes gene_type:complete